MADVQLTQLATAAAPLVYTVPQGVEIRVKAVRAEYDGTAAAGAFLPQVHIVSDAGLTVARASDQGVSVAAGGTADASFFPGVKHAAAAAATTTDSYPINEDAGILTPGSDIYSLHWAAQGVANAACLYNGFIASTGAQGAYITWRFMLGPFGSIHEFVTTFRVGPGYGAPQVYLASIPENDPGSGAADPTGVLHEIDTLSWVKAYDLQGYAAVAAPNMVDQRGWQSHGLRVMGAAGAPLTTAVFDGQLGVFNIDGGPGPYAMRIVSDAKALASTGYQFDIQNLHRKRTDWAFG